jgi:RNA polymerase sigma factor (sigma-70 family)
MDETELRTELERHHRACQGWALSCCSRNATAAEEVLQSAYLRVLDGRARYAGQAQFRTWLFGVIRRTAAEERRRFWLRRLRLARYARSADGPTAPSEQAVEADLERSEEQAAFASALDALSARQRQVLHLVFYQDLTIEEAAEVMGVSLGAARQHYARGKDRMRRWLEDRERGNGRSRR